MIDLLYQQNEPLLRHETWQGLTRCRRSGVAIEWQDLFQELCEVFTRAAKGFRQTKGAQFATYLVRSCRNHVGNVIKRARRSRRYAPVVSINTAFADGSMEEVIADEAPLADETLARRQVYEAKLKGLTPLARRLVVGLLEPTPEILAQYEAVRCRAVTAQQRGLAEPIPRHLTLEIVARALGMSATEYRVGRTEIQKRFGVML